VQFTAFLRDLSCSGLGRFIAIAGRRVQLNIYRRPRGTASTEEQLTSLSMTNSEDQFARPALRAHHRAGKSSWPSVWLPALAPAQWRTELRSAGGNHVADGALAVPR
jgi:hypothetical protein